MEQSTFTNLTGITLSSSQQSRFTSVSDLAAERLEELLGWPLDPCDWDDQYIEIGKTRSEWWSYPDVDTSDLDAPDEVEGATRLYTWNPNDPYLFIDPAVTIHAVKVVKNGVTYKTFDPNDYSLRLVNGRETFGKYIQFSDALCGWWGPIWDRDPIVSLLASQRRADGDYVQIAVDADWAFDELPGALKDAWAGFVNYRFDLKRDVKSESMLSHSYTKATHVDPEVTYASVLKKYVGPKGTAHDPLVLV